MKQENPDSGKSVVVDVESVEEINETFNPLKQEQLPLRKRMFLLKTNVYENDPENYKLRVITHLSLGEGT